jgi:hypothetical protein
VFPDTESFVSPSKSTRQLVNSIDVEPQEDDVMTASWNHTNDVAGSVILASGESRLWSRAFVG